MQWATNVPTQTDQAWFSHTNPLPHHHDGVSALQIQAHASCPHAEQEDKRAGAWKGRMRLRE